jgi:hypothetical protein
VEGRLVISPALVSVLSASVHLDMVWDERWDEIDVSCMIGDACWLVWSV